MAFTRYHDDPNRIAKRLEESTFTGNYFLNTPGQGLQLPFQEDPQLRLQHWGANLMTDSTNLESDLFGLGRKLSHNHDRTYKQDTVSNSQPLAFVSAQPFVEESRASHPAWMYKDADHTRWEVPILNPLANLEKQFQDNIHTRILEKDYFRPSFPVMNPSNHGYSYVDEPICFNKNKCAFANCMEYK